MGKLLATLTFGALLAACGPRCARYAQYKCTVCDQAAYKGACMQWHDGFCSDRSQCLEYEVEEQP